MRPRLWPAITLGLAFLPAASGAAQSSYESSHQRDPFIPLVHDGRFVAVSGGLPGGSAASDVHLAGIVWDPAGSSLALINETEVKVGDQIQGYQVMEIREDAVVLLKDGKPLVLQLSFEPLPPSQEP